MLTAKGYTRKTFNELFEERAAKARELFGADIRTDELSVMGKILRIGAHSDANTEELAELIYYAISPESATGNNLDRLCVFVGISRNTATPSSYTVKVMGEEGTTVPIGFLVSTESEINFYNTAEATIGEDGTCEITVECTDAGEMGNVNALDINVVVNPEVEIEGVEGVRAIKLGTDTESDHDLRKRFYGAREGFGSCTETAIRAALMRVPTVVSADVIVNDGDSTDAGGRPPKSFECFIQGGEDYHKQIAETIYEKKPLGIKTYGTISQTIYDNAGREKTINFSHTSNINVYVKLKVSTDATFDDVKSVEQIQENITDYINGLGVGSNVILSALYGKIHGVQGVVDVTAIQLSTNGSSWSTANITVSEYETALCQTVEVER